MATGDAIDRIYGRAASFGRDVFHYIVTSTLFVVVCSVPFWERCSGSWPPNLPAAVENPGLQIVFLFVAVIVLFCIGHVLLSVGFCIRNNIWTRFSCCEHVAKYEGAILRIKKLRGDQAEYGDERDAHLDAEISVFIKEPDLHARFVERYNTCLLYTSPSPRDGLLSRMPSSA